MSNDFKEEDLLFMIRKIALGLSAQLEQSLKSRSITGIQVYFLVYILRHHLQGTCLTELCREIGVSKATLSALIRKMKEKEYLYILEDPEDVRKKKVLPTARLVAEGSDFIRKADEMESQICSVLDGNDRIKLWNLEKKLMEHFEMMGENEKEKQEVC